MRRSLEALGSKWTLLILRDVGYLGLHKFGQILRNNPGLSPRVLSRRLGEMREEGLVRRIVDGDEISYKVTVRGEDAFYVLLAFLRYGLKYYEQKKTRSIQKPSISSLLKFVENGQLA